MLLRPTNFLLLDEPTNHLDMRAKDVLLDALLKYTGTVVFVSHDRYFIDKLATRVFEVADGNVHVYPGNYEDYLWRKQEAANGTPMTASSVPRISTTANGLSPEAPTHVTGNQIAESKAKRLNPIKRKQMEERSREIEEDIARVEAAIAISERALLNYVSVEETKRQNLDLEKHREELIQLMAEWEELGQSLESG
jgi:ATP-binding cassette subfamily F protein 3